MELEIKLRKKENELGSGKVFQAILPSGRCIWKFETWGPEKLGPGPTGTYLIEDENLILVDPGSVTGDAIRSYFELRHQKLPPGYEKVPGNQSEIDLREGLRIAGYSMADIETIVLTHGHEDHTGLTKKVKEESDAKVMAHYRDVKMISDEKYWLAHHMEWWNFLRTTGMRFPKFFSEPSEERLDFIKFFHRGFGVDEEIREDGYITDSIHVFHTPGHSPGGICLLVGKEGEKKVLISGDTVLYPITPHPDDLTDYLKSLKKISGFKDVIMVFPGHDDFLEDLYFVIKYIRRHHQNRLEMILNACKEPATIWEITLTPNLYVYPIRKDEFNPPAVRETKRHLDLLEEAKDVERVSTEGDLVYYQNTGTRNFLRYTEGLEP